MYYSLKKIIRNNSKENKKISIIFYINQMINEECTFMDRFFLSYIKQFKIELKYNYLNKWDFQ